MKWKDINTNYVSHIEQLEKLTPMELLEVKPNFSIEELKKAYKKKIKLYHPDTSDLFMKQFNLEMSKLINNAYQELLKTKNG